MSGQMLAGLSVMICYGCWKASSRTYGGDEKRDEAAIIPFTHAVVQVGTMMVDPLDTISALPLAAIHLVSLPLPSLRCMITHGLTNRQ